MAPASLAITADVSIPVQAAPAKGTFRRLIDRLIVARTARAERARSIRAYMTRNGDPHLQTLAMLVRD